MDEIVRRTRKIINYRYYYLLLLPAVALFVVFYYFPMYGVTLAFKDFRINEGIFGSPWVGMKHFNRLFESRVFWGVFKNTVLISTYKLIFGFPSPIVFALFIDSIRSVKTKKIFQTISYLPHFISWMILGSILGEVFSQTRGPISYVIQLIGSRPLNLLAEPDYFRSMLVITGIWKEIGWGSVVYLAAITSIDQEQFEAARIEGANSFQLIRYITLPNIASVIIVMFILQVGNILNANFDQVFNLYTPAVLSVGDIIDTYVYRIGIESMNYSFSTAVGVFKNIVGFGLVIITNMLVKRIGDGEYKVW